MSNENKVQAKKSGLTFISLLALLYVALVLEPAAIYLGLLSSTGGWVSGYMIQFVVLMLFSEIASLMMGRNLTPQEGTIIFFLSPIMAGGGVFGGLLINLYYRQCPYTIQTGIADKIPIWAAPLLSSRAVITRTFLSSDWVFPIAVSLVSSFLTIVADVSLSYLLIEQYVKTEKLPFPVAPVHREAILTLTNKDPNRIKLFTIAAAASFLYYITLYGLPLMFSIAPLIPFPWIDLTYVSRMILGGSAFAISTDLLQLALGWLIPWEIVLSAFLTSAFVFLIGNPLALRIKSPFFEMWQKDWTPMMDFSQIWQRSLRDVWISPTIGVFVAAAIIPLFMNWRSFIKAISGLSRPSEEREANKGVQIGSTVVIMIGYLGSVTVGFLLSYWLLKDTFAKSVVNTLLLAAIWYIVPFLQAILTGRMIAESSMTIQIPYIKEAMIYASGYTGVDVWFAPVQVTSGAASLVHYNKVCEMTNTDWGSFIKAYFLAIILSWIFGFIYWSLFWKMSPIPSYVYPWTLISWPIGAINLSVWITRAYNIFIPELMVAGFIVTALLYGISLLLHLPIALTGIAIGMGSDFPSMLQLLIGASLERYYLRKKFGKAWEDQYKPVIVAGLSAGLGLILALSVAVAILRIALFSNPY